MSKERERRWLVTSFDPDIFRSRKALIEQGYVGMDPESMRVRIMDGERAFYTFKQGTGIERDENEKKDVNVDDATFVFDGCKYRLRKTRYYRNGWEFDVFEGNLVGVVLAEFESADCDAVVPPPWFQGVEVTDSVSNWHLARLAHNLRGAIDVRSLRDLLLLPQRLPRVVFTGGPCSGKTEAMDTLKSEFAEPVHFMPEMATMVITHGVRPRPDEHFQGFLYRTQRDFESITDMQARDAGKKLLVLDRGSIDNAAYLPGGLDEFEKVCHTKRKDEFALYDKVLCFEVAPEAVYEEKKRNNPARSETYAEARDLQDRIVRVWSTHPGFQFVPNSGSMANKIEVGRWAVGEFLSRP